jgi:hypothetical protein
MAYLSCFHLSKSLRISLLSSICMIILLGGLSASAQPFFTGVPGCTTHPCQNVVPCMQCTGNWTDQFTGTWSITSDASYHVTGRVNTAVPGCVHEQYTVSGTIHPTSGAGSINGGTSVNLTASSPSPGTDPGCQVAPQVILTANFENDGCDLVGPSNAVETSVFGNFSTTFSKPADTPSGETTYFQGWSSVYLTVGQWRSTLTTSLNLNGRQVTEQPGFGTYRDNCYFTGSTVPPASLSGGVWNVGYYSTNNWDDDYVGFGTGAVTYYRGNFRTPCSTNVPQQMNIYTHGQDSFSFVPYSNNSVGEGIPNYVSVKSTRQGQTMTKNWP